MERKDLETFVMVMLKFQVYYFIFKKEEKTKRRHFGLL